MRIAFNSFVVLTSSEMFTFAFVLEKKVKTKHFAFIVRQMVKTENKYGIIRNN